MLGHLGEIAQLLVGGVRSELLTQNVYRRARLAALSSVTVLVPPVCLSICELFPRHPVICKPKKVL